MWILKANAQLNGTAMLPGMRRVVGQPDLHPGNQYPIGATFITQKFIYPALIGNDIVSRRALYRGNSWTNANADTKKYLTKN